LPSAQIRGDRMNLTAIKPLAEQQKRRKAHIDREKGSIYYHGQRVANTVLQLRRMILPDDESHDEILTAAAWFHDIGKDIEPHAHTGALLTRDILQEHCTAEELDEICELIALHCDRKPDRTYSPWVKLLQDADLLDHFGSAGVWIMFMIAASKGESPEQTQVRLDDFLPRYDRNRALINYPQSIEFFDEKVTFEREFFERFRLEAEGNLL